LAAPPTDGVAGGHAQAGAPGRNLLNYLNDAIEREVQAFGGTIPLLKKIDALDPRAAREGKSTASISDDYPLIQMEVKRLRQLTRRR
jgi:hypothetical protein